MTDLLEQTSAAAPDIEKLQALAGKVMGDLAGAMGVLMGYIGDQTGVYRTMADGEWRDADEIADLANVDARYLTEWLSANAALGYVLYDASTGLFAMTPEQVALFASEGAATDLQGFFQSTVGQYMTHAESIGVFRSGAGLPWSSQHACMICGTDRVFRPGYEANLISNWIPALDGIEEILERGGEVADIGCGEGSSAMLLAQRFPRSAIHGFDLHGPSIERARERGREAGLTNLTFNTAAADTIPAWNGYDLVCMFDALHDMGDPVGAARHACSILRPGGSLMLVEPRAGDDLSDNLHPLGAIFYSASTLACLPNSKSQPVAACLGAQAGPARLTRVLNDAGFTSVRIAAETDTNLVIEARA